MTALFALLALAVACGNSPVHSNNAVKPASTVASTPPVVNNSNTASVPNSSMANSSAANKPAAANTAAANKSAAKSKLADPAAADN